VDPTSVEICNTYAERNGPIKPLFPRLLGHFPQRKEQSGEKSLPGALSEKPTAREVRVQLPAKLYCESVIISWIALTTAIIAGGS
jgi:hypothetical protein